MRFIYAKYAAVRLAYCQTAILYLSDIFVLANLLIVLRIKKAIGEVNFLCLGASFLSLMLKIPPFSPHNFWYLRRLIIKYFPRIF